MSDEEDVQIRSDPRIFSGRPIIGWHRITVHGVAARARGGYMPEEIAEAYNLTLSEVNAALDYYAEHREQIDRDLVEDAEDIRRRAAEDTSPLAERLRQARKQAEARRSYG